MRLDSIRFVNFRGFEDRRFELASRFNLLIGDNGTGKTSILHGMSIGLGSLFLGFPEPAQPSTIASEVVRQLTFWNGDQPNIQPQYPVLIDCEGMLEDEEIAWERKIAKAGGRTSWAYSGRLKDTAREMAELVAKNRPVILPVLGYYGTGRVWKQKKLTATKTISPGSRFLGYLNCLDPASDEKRLLEWFKTRELSALQKKRIPVDLEAVREAIRQCIPQTRNVYWDMDADQLAIQQDDRVLYSPQLSDGFRNMLAMVADIAERCVTLNPQLGAKAIEETPGVILIDEIDLHLHPKWQRHVVGDLMRVFAKVQFVATTHSPFIIQSLITSDEVKLHNLDNPAAEEITEKSIEDIAEAVQGVETPQRSVRYMEMMGAAEEYFRALDEADSKSEDDLAAMKERLDELSTLFSDNPAFAALLNLEREAKFAGNGKKHAPS